MPASAPSCSPNLSAGRSAAIRNTINSNCGPPGIFVAFVPFYDRYYLGGLYSLRGFKYRSISPRQGTPGQPGFFSEPIGGDSLWFGSAEYSIPIIDRLRFALFYDVGNVSSKPYDFKLTDF